MDKTDRCDQCGAQAYVKVIIDTGLPLYFCGHDYGTHEESLAAYVISTVDLRHMLTGATR